MKFLEVFALHLLLSFVVSRIQGCTFGDYDLGPLDRTVWDVRWKQGTTNYTYNISICDALSSDSPCGDHSSVCRYINGSQAKSIGSFVATLNITEDVNRKELWLHLTGDTCQADPTRSTRSVINFKCGVSLGSPALIDSNACETYFEWSTYVACKRAPTHKEVKCYVYDKDGLKRDLTPLIQSSTSYVVQSQDARDFRIAVCRDLPDAAEQGCAQGAAACGVYPTNVEEYGRPVQGLQLNREGDIFLQYTTTSDAAPSECSAHSPTTTITFKCPPTRGMGRAPVLISDLDCDFQVEWLTEFACPEDTLVTRAECKLTKEPHGVDIDLTPLRNGPNGNDKNFEWLATMPTGTSSEFSYKLKICPDQESQFCGGNMAAGCQTKSSDAAFAKRIGTYDNKLLRYSDRNLTLIYDGGEKCSSNFARRTVINFHCDPNAGGPQNTGWPYFSAEDSCTYIFDWDTKYACVEHPLSAMCSVQNGTKNFDLTALMKTGNVNWEAESGHNEDPSRYFINLCHEVVRYGPTANCPENAAVCRVEGDTATSLGRFVESPTLQQDGSIRLHYKDGGESNKETIITFQCKPGDLESAPVFVRASYDLGTHEFVWRTAAACVQASKTGSGCKVFDDDLGLDFDLSSLTRQEGQTMYEVREGEYVYKLNVCGHVTGSKCNGNEHDNAAVCQEKSSDAQFVKNAGQPNTELTYYDGMINLTYTHGDAYSSGPLRASQIMFLCNRTAGHGQPEFVDEHDGKYMFKWMTALACPEAPAECLVSDPTRGHQYDLSSLTKGAGESNWNTLNQQTHLSDNNEPRQKFYINLCRPLNPMSIRGEQCDLDASVCMTEFEESGERIKVKNLGKVDKSGSLSIQSEGRILVTYNSNDTCQGAVKYSTSIYLNCLRGAITTSPVFVETTDECAYVFQWDTEAACPLQLGSDTGSSTPAPPAEEENPCQLEDVTSEYVFNLNPLKKKGDDFYEVNGPDQRKYKLNICGKVAGCPKIGTDDSAVCDDNNAIGRVSTQLRFSDGGLITLTYAGTDDAEAELTFQCDRSTHEPHIRFVKQDNKKLLFDVHTALACAPRAVDCVVTDDLGVEYDLSTLARVDGNWNVLETATGRSDLRYFINVCRPVNIGTGVEANCPGGPIGGCQVSVGGSSFSMGYVLSSPVAREDGSLSIRYQGGSLCHKNTPFESHRSTRINFFCSQVEEDPVFQEETPECEYIFNWRTPSACAQKRIVGENCQVSDPLHNYEFNLNWLRKLGTSDYEVSDGDYKYLLNVCGVLNSGTGACEGGGACQTKPDDPNFAPIKTGDANDKLTYEDGHLSLTYTGGKDNCHKQFERKTIINFQCDHGVYGSKGPVFTKEDDNCVYIFSWATQHACMPFKVADCGIVDKDGNQFELSSLTLTNDNYVVESRDPDNTDKFILNVCTTLVHQQGQTCPPNSAACRVKTSASGPVYESLGSLPRTNEEKLLSFDMAGNLILTYTHGNTSCGGNTESETIIAFTCDKTAIDSQPQFLYEDRNSCQTLFTWKTAAACRTNEQEDTGNACTVTNPRTGFEFDIKALAKDEGYTVDDHRGHKFKLNVCGSPKSSPCGDNAGSCQYKADNSSQNWNAGNSNSALHFEDGLIWLNYTGGKECHNGQYRRSSIIYFVCAKEGTGTGHPVFIDETDDCTYYFSWHTELACEEQTDCTVTDNKGHVLDLSLLVKAEGHHLAVNSEDTDSDSTFYINVCRPLNPIDSTLCPPLSSACKVSKDGKATSIGRLHGRPLYDSTSDTVKLTYDRGEACPTNHAKNSTARITFKCERGPSQGQPVLEEITADCQYIFSWPTNVVCPQGAAKQSTNCTFTDPRTQTVYDLSPLQKSTEMYKVVSGDVTYYVSPCATVSTSQGPDSQCRDAAVCKVQGSQPGQSFGKARKETFIMEGKTLKVGYTDGSQCGGRKAATYILFECADNTVADNGTPEMFSESECVVVLRWRTPLACPPVTKDCALVHDGKTFDLHVLSRNSGSWHFQDGEGNEYWMNLCQSVHESRCSREAAVCWKGKREREVHTIGTVKSQVLSYENNRLVVKYSDGDQGACAVRKRRSSDQPASVNIYFRCGESIGRPEVIPKKGDSCSFDFLWVSSVACKVQRVPVSEINHIIADPWSKNIVDLKELASYTVRNGTFSYEININGATGSKECEGAVVCQRDGTKAQSLADVKTVKYFIQDGILQAEYESDTPCAQQGSRTASTIITLRCAAAAAPPTLLYTSVHCHYMFDWYTPVACLTPDSLGPVSAPEDSSGGSQHKHTAGVVVGVLLSIIVIVVLLVIFHNKDRRIWCAYRARSLFRKAVPLKRMSYSELSSSDNAENALLARGERASLPSFHDDSDEDLIL